MGGVVEWFKEQVPQIGLKVGGALLIVLAGWILAKLATKLAGKIMALSRFSVPKILEQFIREAIMVTIMTIAGIMALAQLGVNIGPLIAGLGVTGFIIGFATQQVLANLAAGFMILLYRPYDIGHFVDIGGVKGTVKEVNLTTTILRSEEGEKLIVPNARIWGQVMRNKSVKIEEE
jgi:small conductance mechanosensitive channel